MPLVEGGGAADLLKEDLFATRRLEVIHLQIVDWRDVENLAQ